MDACTSTTRAAHYSSLLIMANWVYSIELFNSEQYLRALRGEDFASCKPTAPDLFAHRPDMLPQAIAHLQSSLKPQECPL